MSRPKYKEMWKESQNEYADCKLRLMSCECFIKEAKVFITKHGLSEEFNKILNDKYGLSLINTFNHQWVQLRKDEDV